MKLLIIVLLLLSSKMAVSDTSPTWNRIILSGGAYTLMGLAPPELRAADTLNIFLEGDGAPGTALELAEFIGGNSVYIARPCQYFSRQQFTNCDKALLTSHRYSRAVIDSISRAITAMKIRYQASRVRLIGFSGGGAIATIIAAQRDDIDLLVTVAGNLDHKRWTEFNEIAPLIGSLNPVDFSGSLEGVRQIHLIGERDNVVPGSVLSSYLAHMQKLDNVKSYIISGADHLCCWSMALADVLD